MTKKNTITQKLLPIIMSVMLFGGCTSTTNMGTTAVDRKQLLIVPAASMLKMSQESYAKEIHTARQERKLDTNKKQVKRLRTISDKIITQVSIFRPDAVNWNWEVHTLKSDELNAYVRPGGKIMFYTGIIDNLELTDSEIAAIMGHEIAHALREHSREAASRQLATQIGFSVLATSLGLNKNQVNMASMLSKLGFSLPHNRKQESEADVLGIELAARAGYNPSAAVTLWQKMSGRGKSVPEFMSTHPSSKNRIAKLEKLVTTVMPLYTQALNNTSKSVSKRSKKNNTRNFTKYKGS